MHSTVPAVHETLPIAALAPHHAHVHGFRFAIFGSTGRIRIAGVSMAHAEAFVADAVRWLRDLETRLTRFSITSLVGRINACAGSGNIQPDADLLAVLAAADLAWRLTDGRFDASSLPLTRLWSDPQRTTWPTFTEITSARSLVDWPAVHRTAESVSLPRRGMALDLGGVGKEWCVDQLIARAVSAGIADCLIELGGDCAASGHQPGHDGWWVTLPSASAALLLSNEALATSGVGTRRRELAGRCVPHLIDARSGHPASGVLRSVSVLARDCLSAGIHASDVCLLDEANPTTIAERSGGLPSWCVASDDRLLSDPRLLNRLHPIKQRNAMVSA